MAITKLNSLAIPDDTIVEADLSYPLTGFSSTGIDDNATSTAITISSSQNVGIGTDPSPALGTGLHIRGSGYANLTLQKSASNVGHALEFTDENNAIQYRIGTNFASGGQNLLFAYGSTPAIGMMLDSSGNLLVGTAQHRPANNNVNGNSIDGTFGIESSVTSGGPLTLNRKSTDGGIASFKKDGTTIGVIGTKSSGLYIGTDDAGIFFNHHGGGNLDAIFPYDLSTNSFYNGQMNVGGPSNQFGTGYFNYTTVDNGAVYNNFSGASGVSFSGTGTTPCDNTGTLSDGSHDLGRANARFKDLYLSGGAYLGGTASANHLDDYEEGTWTPVIGGSTGTSGQSYTTQVGHYTKIGRQVIVTFLVDLSNKGTITGDCVLSGLPFACLNNNGSGAGVISYFDNLTANVSSMSLNGNQNNASAYINHVVGSGATATVNTTAIIGTSTRLDGVFSYFTSA